jgi:hypothetical protein
VEWSTADWVSAGNERSCLRNDARFGRNVLRGLIQGIDDFIELRQPPWRRFRSLGPVLLGSAMWINDRELIDKLAELSGAFIVVTKQSRGSKKRRELEELRQINEGLPGPRCALSPISAG